MKQRRTYETLPDIQLGAEVDAKVRRMTEQAEQDIGETRVNFRWGKPQLATVKRAAALYGVPYQTYVKQVLLRQALADIKAADPVIGHS